MKTKIGYDGDAAERPCLLLWCRRLYQAPSRAQYIVAPSLSYLFNNYYVIRSRLVLTLSLSLQNSHS